MTHDRNLWAELFKDDPAHDAYDDLDDYIDQNVSLDEALEMTIPERFWDGFLSLNDPEVLS